LTAFQLIGPLPVLTLDHGCTITAEAIDEATGAAVTGVTVSAVAIYGVNFAPDMAGDQSPDATPLFVPIPASDE
jgi:hypothetical protein